MKQHPKKYSVSKRAAEDKKIILACIKVLKRENGTRCKSYALGCFNCGIGRVIEGLEAWVDFLD